MPFRISRSLAALVLAAAVSGGCMNVDLDLWVEPDGSGRSVTRLSPSASAPAPVLAVARTCMAISSSWPSAAFWRVACNTDTFVIERETTKAVAPAARPSAQPAHSVVRVPSRSSARNVATAAPNTAPSVFEPYKTASAPRWASLACSHSR